MEKMILKLETSLFYYKWIHNRDYLEKILDDEFEEIGQSGKICHKQECMEGLLSCTKDRGITMLHAQCTKITEDVCLVRYVIDQMRKTYFEHPYGINVVKR